MHGVLRPRGLGVLGRTLGFLVLLALAVVSDAGRDARRVH